MKIFVETERLILREILPTDIYGMFELHSDPAVHRFLGNKTVKSKEEVDSAFRHTKLVSGFYGVVN